MSAQPSLNARKIVPVMVILVVAGAIYLVPYIRDHTAVGGHHAAAGQGEYLFCTWNMENLFDDRHDKRNSTDEPYDSWFADVPADRELKYQRLAEILLKMNGGKGPDILVGIEVESKRAAELLAEALNKALPKDAAPYSTVVMEEISAGRHIAPAVLSRLPIGHEHKPRVLSPQRILICNLTAGGHELTIFATHWTSHRSDEGGGGKRDKYADLVYGRANEIFHRDAKADIVVCGDFNDSPDDPAVRDHLHTASTIEVREAKELQFLNLMAGKHPKPFGTHYFHKPLIYDQICVAPGLLDDLGWSCNVDSIDTWTEGLIKSGSKLRKPWRFGNRNDHIDRGYSDHFPVTVKMRVNGGEISR